MTVSTRSRHLLQTVATLRRSDKNVRRDSAKNKSAARPDFRSGDACAGILMCVTVLLATVKIGETYGKHWGVEKCVQDLD